MHPLASKPQINLEEGVVCHLILLGDPLPVSVWRIGPQVSPKKEKQPILRVSLYSVQHIGNNNHKTLSEVLSPDIQTFNARTEFKEIYNIDNNKKGDQVRKQYMKKRQILKTIILHYFLTLQIEKHFVWEKIWCYTALLGSLMSFSLGQFQLQQNIIGWGSAPMLESSIQ